MRVSILSSGDVLQPADYDSSWDDEGLNRKREHSLNDWSMARRYGGYNGDGDD